MRNHILVINDDVSFQQQVANQLETSGYKVEVAGRADDGLQKAYNSNPDLIILDLMASGDNVWQTCQHLRVLSDVPIMMLSSLGTDTYQEKGIDSGADIYLTKPVGMKELTARIKALLRRTYGNDITELNRTSILRYEDLIIDPTKPEVTRAGKRIELRSMAFKLLICLIQHRGKTLPHNFLLREVWGPEYIGQVDVLRQSMSYLRKQLGLNQRQLRSIWGIGYRLE